MSLLGQVGSQDVQDVMDLLDLCLNELHIGDRQKVTVFGGSHGGFLAAHLTGQHAGKLPAEKIADPKVLIILIYLY